MSIKDMNFSNLEVGMCLNDIKTYVQGALNYFNGYDLDKEEIIYYLACVEEMVDMIKYNLVCFLEYVTDLFDEYEYQDLQSLISSLMLNLMDYDLENIE